MSDDSYREGLCAECEKKVFIHKSFKTAKEYSTNTTDRRSDFHSCRGWKVKGKKPQTSSECYGPSTTEDIHRPLEKVEPSLTATGSEQYNVEFTSAADLPDIPNFYRVTKIIVAREDNKWFSAEDSDKVYGKGKAKTEGYGVKPSAILEAKVQTSDRLTIENVMDDLATIIRIHNKRELQQ